MIDVLTRHLSEADAQEIARDHEAICLLLVRGYISPAAAAGARDLLAVRVNDMVDHNKMEEVA